MRLVVAGLLGLAGLSAVAAQCSPSPCGINTNCEVNGAGAAVCRCQAGWDHAPGSNTIEGEQECSARHGSTALLPRLSQPPVPVRPARPAHPEQQAGRRSGRHRRVAAAAGPPDPAGPLRAEPVRRPGPVPLHRQPGGVQLPGRVRGGPLHRLHGRPLLPVPVRGERRLREER